MIILSPPYKLGFSDNNTYILSLKNEKCAYLSPLAAICLRIILSCPDKASCIEKISSAFSYEKEKAESTYDMLLTRLGEYLEEECCEGRGEIHNYLEPADIEKTAACSTVHEHPIKKDPVPTKLKFYLTDYCTRRCIYCFAGAAAMHSGVKAGKDFLSPARFRDIIKEAESIGVRTIELSGGDPLLVDDICDYVRIMTEEYSGVWSLSTKSLVTPLKAEKLYEAGLREMQVSLDSHISDHADKMMGSPGAFEEILQTIDNLRSAGIDVYVKAVITSLNADDIPDFYRWICSFGVKGVRSSFYYASANRHSQLLYASNEQIKHLNEVMPIITDGLKAEGFEAQYDAGMIRAVTKTDDRIFCGGYTGSISVRYDGETLFCDSLNHTDIFTSGNLKEKSIMDIWESKRAAAMGDPAGFKERFEGTECYNCGMYENCFYKRCWVRTFNEYGTYFEKDPACPFGPADYIT